MMRHPNSHPLSDHCVRAGKFCSDACAQRKPMGNGYMYCYFLWFVQDEHAELAQPMASVELLQVAAAPTLLSSCLQ